MPLRVGSRLLSVSFVVSLLLSAHCAFAQKVTVDADPAHVANTFSPPLARCGHRPPAHRNTR